MTFPDTPLPIKVEIDADGTWADISAYVYQRAVITISRGKEDESGVVGPSRCNLTLNNRDGRFSPRNPVGAYYGSISRNTQLRVSVTQVEGWLMINQPTGTTVTTSHVSAPDNSGLDITGDLDIRFEADLDSWRDALELVSKWTESGNQRSYSLRLLADGTLSFAHSTDGTDANTFTVTSDPVPITTGRLAIRATLDVSNGGNRVREFFTSDSIDGTWTQLGDTSTISGTTSVFASTATLHILDNPNSSLDGSLIHGKVYAAKVLNGIAGTVVAKPYFTTQTAGATSFNDGAPRVLTGDTATSFHGIGDVNTLTCLDADAADIAVGDFVILTDSGGTYKEETVFTVTAKASAFGFTNIDFTPDAAAAIAANDIMKECGNVWTVVGDLEITYDDRRFVGEVSAWPQKWDTTGNDVWTPIEASGVTRRLIQGQQAVKSTMYRATIAELSDVVAYWPCEDESGATVITSAIPNGQGITITDTMTVGQDTGFKSASRIITMGTTSFQGSVFPAATPQATPIIDVRFLMEFPAAATLADNSVIMRVKGNGTARFWDVRYETGGSLSVQAYTVAGVLIDTTGDIAFVVDEDLCQVQLHLAQNGADVDIRISVQQQGSATVAFSTDTFTGVTIGVPVIVQMNPDNLTTFNTVPVGHIAIRNAGTDFSSFGAVNCFAGESSNERIRRLTSEEGLDYYRVGGIDTTTLGNQVPGKLIDLLREAETSDVGVLYEPRDALGVAFRSRETMYSQPAFVELDYEGAHLSEFEPTEDDQTTVNFVVVSRIGGGNGTAELTSGALSTATPPAGVGKYDTEIRVSAFDDSDLQNQASFRVNLGTVDEARFPDVTLDLARSQLSALSADICRLDVGDGVSIVNPPAGMPPDAINQLVLGYKEYLNAFERTITFNLAPSSPWKVAYYIGDTPTTSDYLYTTDGTLLNEALDSTETGIDVITALGPVWSTTADDFDIMVGGERMTVTAVSGTGTTQTFTVTRSVNGIVKSHASGATVELFFVARYAL